MKTLVQGWLKFSLHKGRKFARQKNQHRQYLISIVYYVLMITIVLALYICLEQYMLTFCRLAGLKMFSKMFIQS